MKTILAIILSITFISCEKENIPLDFEKATKLDQFYIENELPDSLLNGKTYLPIYSEIYSKNMNGRYLTTATVSMRNIDPKDTIYIRNIEYFDTQGNKIRTYIKKPIYLKPMETKEIVIDYLDKEGGTGANFIFDWSCKNTSNKPFFQAVMVTITGTFGLSFTTEGKEIIE